MKINTWKPFGIFLVLLIIGSLSIYPAQKRIIEHQLENMDIQQSLPIEILAAISLLNPIIIGFIALIIGHFLAKKVSLNSIIYARYNSTGETKFTKKGILTAVLFGVLSGLFVLLVNTLLRPYLPNEYLNSSDTYSNSDILTSILYGGIVEELTLRWGVMTLLVFCLWKIFNRKSTKPSNSIFWISIIIAAFIFSIGHFSSINSSITLLLFIRIFITNFVAGSLFGYVYWRINIETAMIAHISANLSLLALSLIITS